MNAADAYTYRTCMAEWRRAEPEQREVRHGRDARGRRVIDFISYGVVRVRLVDVGRGLAEVYTHRARRFRVPQCGPIAFGQWDDPAKVNGTWKRVRPSANY